jgi:hypothetical protein
MAAPHCFSCHLDVHSVETWLTRTCETGIPCEKWICISCLENTFALTAEQAQYFGRLGYRLRHVYYMDTEWLQWDGGWKTEDGFDHPHAFEDAIFESGWTAYKPKPNIN